MLTILCSSGYKCGFALHQFISIGTEHEFMFFGSWGFYCDFKWTIYDVMIKCNGNMNSNIWELRILRAFKVKYFGALGTRSGFEGFKNYLEIPGNTVASKISYYKLKWRGWSNFRFLTG